MQKYTYIVQNNPIKILLIFILIVFCTLMTHAQGMITIEKIKKELEQKLPDTTIVDKLATIGFQFGVIKPDSGIVYCQKVLLLSRKINYDYGEALALSYLAWCNRHSTDYKNSIDILNQSDKIGVKHPYIKAHNMMVRSFVYYDLKDYELSKRYASGAKDIFKSLSNYHREIVSTMILNDILYAEDKIDSCLMHSKLLYQYALENKAHNTLGIVSAKLARAYLKSNMLDSASVMIDRSMNHGINEGNTRVVIFIYQYKSDLYFRRNQLDSAIYYSHLGLNQSTENGFFSNALLLSKQLTDLYIKSNNKDEALRYALLTADLNDKMYGLDKINLLNKTIIDQQIRSFEQKELDIKNKNKRTLLFLCGIALVFLIIVILSFWTNKRINKEKKQVVSTLNLLKSTQAQLIQSEKMASLGELTAGIAHEIQNPLNFVNNFSDVSNELMIEMTEELEKGDIEEAKFISADIKQNLEKINHHGKRASDIVKGMLEHSRTSTGKKELTDINALCDEYLRLAYHGLRAKDNSFNATMETHFEPNLPKIDIIPQDIGRVILNLINNAFYAVNERSKKGEADFVPTVSVTTELTANSQLLIAVKDNGSGIPAHIKDKIFQPFFTTKPTGQGTGLGLSLSYDIVKAHGGELKVETNEGEGTGFSILLPIKNFK